MELKLLLGRKAGDPDRVGGELPEEGLEGRVVAAAGRIVYPHRVPRPLAGGYIGQAERGLRPVVHPRADKWNLLGHGPFAQPPSRRSSSKMSLSCAAMKAGPSPRSTLKK